MIFEVHKEPGYGEDYINRTIEINTLEDLLKALDKVGSMTIDNYGDGPNKLRLWIYPDNCIAHTVEDFRNLDGEIQCFHCRKWIKESDIDNRCKGGKI